MHLPQFLRKTKYIYQIIPCHACSLKLTILFDVFNRPLDCINVAYRTNTSICQKQLMRRAICSNYMLALWKRSPWISHDDDDWSFIFRTFCWHFLVGGKRKVQCICCLLFCNLTPLCTLTHITASPFINIHMVRINSKILDYTNHHSLQKSMVTIIFQVIYWFICVKRKY